MRPTREAARDAHTTREDAKEARADASQRALAQRGAAAACKVAENESDEMSPWPGARAAGDPPFVPAAAPRVIERKHISSKASIRAREKRERGREKRRRMN